MISAVVVWGLGVAAEVSFEAVVVVPDDVFVSVLELEVSVEAGDMADVLLSVECVWYVVVKNEGSGVTVDTTDSVDVSVDENVILSAIKYVDIRECSFDFIS